MGSYLQDNKPNSNLYGLSDGTNERFDEYKPPQLTNQPQLTN
ncbi:MAG: hypothetical protein ACLFUW_06740 [Bacteroidales bacterium]